MRIAIIGTGQMAQGLAKGWLKAGHFIAFGSRNPEKKNDVQEAVGIDARIYGYEGALTAGEVVVLAIPYREVESFARKYPELLRGKVVVDISNPVGSQPPDYTAGATVTARAIGDGARVVAAFKNNFSNTLGEPVDSSGVQRDIWYASDDEKAGATVRSLIEDLGFRPVNFGPLKNAVILDLMVPLILDMDRRLNGGARSASWKFQTPA